MTTTDRGELSQGVCQAASSPSEGAIVQARRRIQALPLIGVSHARSTSTRGSRVAHARGPPADRPRARSSPAAVDRRDSEETGRWLVHSGWRGPFRTAPISFGAAFAAAALFPVRSRSRCLDRRLDARRVCSRYRVPNTLSRNGRGDSEGSVDVGWSRGNGLLPLPWLPRLLTVRARGDHRALLSIVRFGRSNPIESQRYGESHTDERRRRLSWWGGCPVRRPLRPSPALEGACGLPNRRLL